MNVFYNSGIRLYKTAARLVSGRNVKARKMLEGQRKTMDYLREKLAGAKGYVWIHVASLGEFEQGRPLMEMIRRRDPGRKILLTFFSPSGYELRKNYDGADAVCYLPFDTPRNAREFLDLVEPSMAIFVKYEFWGNYLQGLLRRGIPTYIISSIFRESQPFFKWWGSDFRKMLRCYTHIFVQDEASRERLATIGVTNVTVAGDTRFDRVTDIMRNTVQMPSIEKFTTGGDFTLIVGSSWPADEDVYLPWVNAHRDVRVIIAPHEFDDERLQRLMERVEGGAQLLSEYEKSPREDVRCLIVNSFGKLSSIYRYGDMAYIGGGFGAGIHNVNEAAVYDMPVVFGPNNGKFKEAADLIACGGGFCVHNAEELSALMDKMLTDRAALKEAGKAAGDYIRRSIGATERIYPAIFGK